MCHELELTIKEDTQPRFAREVILPDFPDANLVPLIDKLDFLHPVIYHTAFATC